MKIVIGKLMMQRYRSILHILDRLIDEGHSVHINRRGSIKYDPSLHYKAPWDISCCSEGTLRYIAKNFGLNVKYLNKILWSVNKHKINKCEIPHKIICTDHMPIENDKQINIPYNHFFCRYIENEKMIEQVIGNGMCEAFRKRQKAIKEKKGQVLIIHPGGGRTILSPLRKHIPDEEVIQNQVDLFNALIQAIQWSDPSKIVIKTHPAPYKNCDKQSMINNVIPNLHTSCEIKVTGKNLLNQICESEFVITMGSSTVIWLLGSRKKWINIIDCSRYNLKSPKRRDKQERADYWMNWPQNTKLCHLWYYFKNYELYVEPKFYGSDLFTKYETLFNMPFSKNCIRIITQ